MKSSEKRTPRKCTKTERGIEGSTSILPEKEGGKLVLARWLARCAHFLPGMMGRRARGALRSRVHFLGKLAVLGEEGSEACTPLPLLLHPFPRRHVYARRRRRPLLLLLHSLLNMKMFSTHTRTDAEEGYSLRRPSLQPISTEKAGREGWEGPCTTRRRLFDQVTPQVLFSGSCLVGGIELTRDSAIIIITRSTRKGLSFSLLMSLHVEGQVVRAGEAPVAMGALERLQSGVLPMVTGQLVRSGEAPLAALPGATVGFFACKESQVEPINVNALGNRLQ